MDKEAKIAHLGFIQGVINRMGGNSFLVKGWTVALVAAIFALASKDANQSFIYIALLPIIVFWFLDAYYLHQESLFRELYAAVANDLISSNIFTMDTKPLKGKVRSILHLAFTISIFPFYLLVTGILIAVAIKSGIEFDLIFFANLCPKK